MRRTILKSTRKAKRSYTLSPESVEFLETLRKKRRATSISAVLDEILQHIRRDQERLAVERELAAYYDSLSDREVKEDQQWGEIAMREFPSEDHT